MAIDPKNALDAAKDIATHAVEKASDIVEDAGHVLRGNVTEGVNAIVEDSLDIATHAVDKAKEVFTGKDKDDTADA